MLENGLYVWRIIESITMNELLHDFKLSEVDFLFLDIEGVEYTALPSILSSEMTKGIFCQVVSFIMFFFSPIYLLFESNLCFV